MQDQVSPSMQSEGGFTLLEVAVASVISMIGLLLLANLFTLAVTQNKQVKQTTSATALAQEKIEELEAIEPTDPRLAINGGLDQASKVTGYYDQVYVDDSGTVTTTIPAGKSPTYYRYWKIEADPDPAFTRTMIIEVHVVAAYAAQGKKPEEAMLVTERSY